MPYLYRYINTETEEVVYVGIVTKDSELCNSLDLAENKEYLERRHRQHKRTDSWYKEIGDDNLVMQYVFYESAIDARIAELWLINFYDTGQLMNVDGTGQLKSKLDLFPFIFGKWRNFGEDSLYNDEQIRLQLGCIISSLHKDTEGLRYNIETGIEYLSKRIREMHKEILKAQKISTLDKQDLFLRARKNEGGKDHENLS